MNEDELGTFRIFRARQATEVGEDVMPMSDMPAGDAAGLSAMVDAGLREGGQAKLLFKDQVAGISLAHAWFKAGYPLPRHSHSADCLYYIISGEVRLGAEVLRAGDGFFVPADALYTYEPGPEGVELLEFRTATKFDIKFKTPPTMWERLLETVKKQQPAWKAAKPPLAVERMGAAD